MNRDTRMWIVVGIAVTTAALASFGIYYFVRPTVVEAPKVFVVVAKKPIAMGTSIAEGDAKLVAWPKDSQVAGAFTNIDQVRNHALVASVLENEPITESKLAKKGVGLTPIIRDGMRAMSVKVNEVIGVAGFVTPGTRVDVLVTILQDRDSMSLVVVQNVEVLTAGAKYDDPEARTQGKPIPSTVVTLMVWPDQAERIALAASQGQIMLALRNPLDKKMTQTSGVTTPELMARATLVSPDPKPHGKIIKPPAPNPGPDPKKDESLAKPCTFETFKAGKREVLPCALVDGPSPAPVAKERKR